jgi:tetratricopeptide (TPR) repeat protein
MNKTKILIVSIVAGVLAIVTVFSCTKNLNKTNPNALPVTGYFNTSAELLQGTNSIYAVMHSVNMVGREWFFIHDLRSDDVASGGGQLEVARAQILNGGTTPSNAVMNGVWNNYFTMILRANTVINAGPTVTDNTALRDRCVAEAKFLRGWAYYELVTMWGAVPLYTKPVLTPDDFQPRAAVADVYKQIIQDLTDAAGVLPGKSGYAATDQGRATAAAANAMLGRAYMQQGDYANAKAALLKIPTSGADGYSLVSNYNDNFTEETEFNNESIFEVVFFDKGDQNFNWGGNGTGDGPAADQTTVRNQEYCPVAWRNLIPSDALLAEFENTATGAAKTDPRFGFEVYKTGDAFDNGTATLTDAEQNGNASKYLGATIKISYRKYTLIYKQSASQASFAPGGNNMRIIRYAEVLLMLAECENELGNSTNAVGYLNQIRARASVAMPAYPTAQFPTGTKDQVTQAIIHEKRVEMADEEVRNIDILRWRPKGYLKTEPFSYFKAGRDELLPIPQAELDNNPKLGTGGIAAQNPGY